MPSTKVFYTLFFYLNNFVHVQAPKSNRSFSSSVNYTEENSSSLNRLLCLGRKKCLFNIDKLSCNLRSVDTSMLIRSLLHHLCD